MSMDLPAELSTAIEAVLHGVSGTDVARRSASISALYRDGQDSDRTIATAADAVAYMASRFPATYAAAGAALEGASAAMPEFAPKSLLDIGAGPGTASWAAQAVWPGLDRIRMVDGNAHFLALARTLTQGSSDPALRHAEIVPGNIPDLLPSLPPADLVVANYAVGELPPERLVGIGVALWELCQGMLVIVEPGTTQGYRRILALREVIIERGGAIIAPCPHDRPCPLAAPDWCHFAQRLTRSRSHRHAKSGRLAFEDEKYAYLAAARDVPARRPSARLLSPPRVTKAAVTMTLCTRDGFTKMSVPRRDKSGYHSARNKRWGDAVYGPD